MSDRPKVSVAMATYNGEKYIQEQLESILVNLEPADEVIVSDDGSTDKTLEIARSLHDARIKIIRGEGKGVKQNFANAISHSTGEIIFLADQDDIWREDKVKQVMEIFLRRKDVTLVIHDAEVFNDETGEIIYPSFFQYRDSGAGVKKNIWKNTYIGCCMAFRKELTEQILPIPATIEMHDQWIGVLSDKYGRSYFLPEILLKYRRHAGNESSMKHYGLMRMISNRVRFLREYRKK